MVLVGPSGCGKTTSLRMINRLIEPTSGQILLDGRDVMQANPSQLRRGIGYVIQQTGLFPHRTIEDNIATVPLLNGLEQGQGPGQGPRADGARRAGRRHMARRYPHQLSGGQQQRVGVARALAADPPVLLMDEPFSAVDPIVRASLQDELIRLQAELHKTIVMVTHDVEEAIKVGDIVAVFRPGGHLAQVDTPERLLGAPADDYVEDFVGFDRGIRRLSFFSAGGLDLDVRRDAAARTPRSTRPAESPSAAAIRGSWSSTPSGARGAGSPPPTWPRCRRDSRLADVPLAPVGHTFRPDTTRCAPRWTPRCCPAPSGPSAWMPTAASLGVTSYERLRDAIRAAEDAADAALRPPHGQGRRRCGPGRGRGITHELAPVLAVRGGQRAPRRGAGR